MEKNNFVVIFLISLIAISPVQGLSIGPANVRLQDVAAFFLLFHYALTQDRLNTNKNYIISLIPLILLLIYSVSLIPFQQFPVRSTFPDLLELISYIVVLLIAAHHAYSFTKYDIDLLLYFLFLITVLGSLSAIVYYILTGSRFIGVIFAFGIAPFGLYYGIFHSLRDINYFVVAGTLIILVRILLAQSRATWILLPIPLLYVILARPQKNILRLRSLLSLGAMIVAVMFSIPVFFPSIISRIISIVEVSQGIFIRPVRWYSGLQLLGEYPFGTGLGTYSDAVSTAAVEGSLSYPQWFSQIVGNSLISQQTSLYTTGTASAHSDLFKFVLELGPVGLCLLLAFWALVIRHITSVEFNTTTLILIASVLFAVLRSFINPGILSGNTTYMFVFVAIVAGKYGSITD